MASGASGSAQLGEASDASGSAQRLCRNEQSCSSWRPWILEGVGGRHCKYKCGALYHNSGCRDRHWPIHKLDCGPFAQHVKARTCVRCGMQDMERPKPFPRCQGCGVVRYCIKICQHGDGCFHRMQCKRNVRRRVANESDTEDAATDAGLSESEPEDPSPTSKRSRP